MNQQQIEHFISQCDSEQLAAVQRLVNAQRQFLVNQAQREHYQRNAHLYAEYTQKMDDLSAGKYRHPDYFKPSNQQLAK